MNTAKATSARKFLIPGIVFGVSLAITIGIWFFIRSAINRQLSLQFENQTRQITSLIQGRMNLYADVLYGAQGLFAASKSVEKNEWTSYVGRLSLSKNYSGISGMSYIERVPKAAVKAYPYAIFPSADKSDYYPITYTSGTSTVSSATSSLSSLSASSSLQTAVGYDASSDPVRFQALSHAADTAEITASGVVPTITTHVPSFAIYAPIYANDMLHDTVEARRKALVGFVYTSFRLQSLFQGLTSDPIFTSDIDMEIYDAAAAGQVSTSTLLFDTNSVAFQALAGVPSSGTASSFSSATNVSVAGRTWTLYFTAAPAYGVSGLDAAMPYIIGIGGILFSILLGWLLYSLAFSREKALAEAIRMTRQFEESQKLFRLSMENAGDMIFITDMSGAIVDANPEACRKLGYGKEELLKLTVPDIDEGWTKERLVALEQKLQLGVPITEEGMQKKKDGAIFPVEVTVSSFESEGHRLMIAITRDISARKEAEDKLKERTAELERLNALMVNRELKMAELKKEIEELKQK